MHVYTYIDKHIKHTYACTQNIMDVHVCAHMYPYAYIGMFMQCMYTQTHIHFCKHRLTYIHSGSISQTHVSTEM